MKWKIEPSTVSPEVATRRVRLVSHLRDVCLMLAAAKKNSPPGPITAFSPWTDADREAWREMEREAAELARESKLG